VVGDISEAGFALVFCVRFLKGTLHTTAKISYSSTIEIILNKKLTTLATAIDPLHKSTQIHPNRHNLEELSTVTTDLRQDKNHDFSFCLREQN